MTKKLTNTSGAQILGKEELKNVKGGDSREEYCKSLRVMADGDYAYNEWTQEEWNNWGAAYSKYCM